MRSTFRVLGDLLLEHDVLQAALLELLHLLVGQLGHLPGPSVVTLHGLLVISVPQPPLLLPHDVILALNVVVKGVLL